MDYNLLNESQKWRDSRDKRIVVFVRLTSWLMVVGSFSWLFIYNSFWLTAMTLLFMTIPGILSLVLVGRGRLATARFLCFYSVTAYFLLACILTAGSLNANSGQQQVHFWFIVLASFSYFFLYDIRPWLRDVIPAALLVLFYLFHFGLIRLPVYMVYPDVDLMNRATILLSLISLFLVTRQFVLQIIRAEEALADSADRLEMLVGSMLPGKIAERLQREQKTFADVYPSCSVLFADIEGFTAWSESRPPDEVAARLNDIFSTFDDLTEKSGLTKIKTIGDSYMVAAGIPVQRDDHAHALVKLGLKMLEASASDPDFKFRIGINSGSVVAGIIGKNTFTYDLWGDTVNIAARMESSGVAGRVNISRNTYELVKSSFGCSYHGKFLTRKRTEIDMYLVEAPVA